MNPWNNETYDFNEIKETIGIYYPIDPTLKIDLNSLADLPGTKKISKILSENFSKKNYKGWVKFRKYLTAELQTTYWNQ